MSPNHALGGQMSLLFSFVFAALVIGISWS
jgi:hypothetical protein